MRGDCTGCGSCVLSCPKDKIIIKEDNKGFRQISASKDVSCDNCEICKTACPLERQVTTEQHPIAFGCYAQDYNELVKSSSGAIFPLISKYIIEKYNGVVFGACFNNEFSVEHKYSETVEKTDVFRCSKYVQSSMDNCFVEAKQFLLKDKHVLFTGTPCQLAGLKSYLGELSDSDKLLCVDLICKGVPSPRIWQDYLNLYRSKYGTLVGVNFRHKNIKRIQKRKPRRLDLKLEFSSKVIINRADVDYYYKLFLGNYIDRESCYLCKFKGSMRYWSDLTLADFLGVDKILPHFPKNLFTSLVLVNSKKGQEIFNDIKDTIIYEEITLVDALKYNPSSTVPAKKNVKHDKFWDYYFKYGFKKARQIAMSKRTIVFYYFKSIVKKILSCIGLLNVARTIYKKQYSED